MRRRRARSCGWVSSLLRRGRPPTLVVKEGYVTVPGGNPGRTYDISPDGQRFLMIKEGSGTDQTAVAPQVILVQHWTEELKRLVPAK